MNFKTFISTALALILISFFGYFALEGPPPEHQESHYDAPHGGCLVVLGEGFAHLEFVLDNHKGLLTAYSLDGLAVMSSGLQQTNFKLIAKLDHGPLELDLKAQKDAFGFEKPDSHSSFSVLSPALIGVTSFEAEIPKLHVKGISFSNINFVFPEGIRMLK